EADQGRPVAPDLLRPDEDDLSRAAVGGLQPVESLPTRWRHVAGQVETPPTSRGAATWYGFQHQDRQVPDNHPVTVADRARDSFHGRPRIGLLLGVRHEGRTPEKGWDRAIRSDRPAVPLDGRPPQVVTLRGLLVASRPASRARCG